MCVRIYALCLFLEPKLQNEPDKVKMYAFSQRCNSACANAQWRLCCYINTVSFLRSHWCVIQKPELEGKGLHAAIAQLLYLEWWLQLIYRHDSNTETKPHSTAPQSTDQSSQSSRRLGLWPAPESLCTSVSHQFWCAIEGFSPTCQQMLSTAWGRRLCSLFTKSSLEYLHPQSYLTQGIWTEQKYWFWSFPLLASHLWEGEGVGAGTSKEGNS